MLGLFSGILMMEGRLRGWMLRFCERLCIVIGIGLVATVYTCILDMDLEREYL